MKLQNGMEYKGLIYFWSVAASQHTDHEGTVTNS